MTEELTALEERARALHEHGDTSDEALEVNAAILALDPTNAAATNRLGVALTKRGQLEDALAVFQDGLAAKHSQ